MAQLNDVISWITEHWGELTKTQKGFIRKLMGKKQASKQYIVDNQISVEEFLREKDDIN